MSAEVGTPVTPLSSTAFWSMRPDTHASLAVSGSSAVVEVEIGVLLHRGLEVLQRRILREPRQHTRRVEGVVERVGLQVAGADRLAREDPRRLVVLAGAVVGDLAAGVGRRDEQHQDLGIGVLRRQAVRGVVGRGRAHQAAVHVVDAALARQPLHQGVRRRALRRLGARQAPHLLVPAVLRDGDECGDVGDRGDALGIEHRVAHPGIEREDASTENRDVLLLEVVGVPGVERTVLVADEGDDVVLLDHLLHLRDGQRLVVLVVLLDELDRVAVDAAVRVDRLRPGADRVFADPDRARGSRRRVGPDVPEDDRIARRLLRHCGRGRERGQRRQARERYDSGDERASRAREVLSTVHRSPQKDLNAVERRVYGPLPDATRHPATAHATEMRRGQAGAGSPAYKAKI